MDENYVTESILNPDQCCPLVKRIACKANRDIYQVFKYFLKIRFYQKKISENKFFLKSMKTRVVIEFLSLYHHSQKFNSNLISLGWNDLGWDGYLL